DGGADWVGVDETSLGRTKPPDEDCDGRAAPLPDPETADEAQPDRITRTIAGTAARRTTSHRMPCRRHTRSAWPRARVEDVPSDAKPIDELDGRLLRELDAAPRVGVLELARRLG